MTADTPKPALPEPDAWLSHDNITGKDHYDKLPVQSMQPGVYAHQRLYAEETVRAAIDAAVAEARAVPNDESCNDLILGFKHDKTLAAARERLRAWLAAPSPTMPTEQPKPAVREYTGVACMCLRTGCHTGPGCPHYSEHCKKHIAYAADAALQGEPHDQA